MRNAEVFPRDGAQALSSRILRSIWALGITLLLTGCNAGEGQVQVDVGSAPLAAAYRVDLYAREPGLGLVEGHHLVEHNQVTLKNVPAGEWSLFIQAQNGDLTTIGHYQQVIRVETDQTTIVTAGTYKPGLPGDALPETELSLESFGPNGEALFSGLFAAGVDSVPAASLTFDLENGEGEATVNRLDLSRRSSEVSSHMQCGTCFITAQDFQRAERTVPENQIRAQISPVGPGETVSLFIITSFQTVTCQRLLNDSQAQNCLIFAEVVNGTPVITESRALQIAQAFDSDNPFQDGDTGIYKETQARFGTEWVANGGRDSDVRVNLVYLSSATIGGEGLFGFFNPGDQSLTSGNSSNAGEILYLNADRANDDLYDALGTIAHELVHLIVYNQKVARDGTFPAGAAPENAVLDEGLAVLNEELSGFTYTGPSGGNLFLLRAVSDLLDDGLNRRYFIFSGSLADYGAGYLFWRYVHDQYGIEAIKNIVTSPDSGRGNVEKILNQPFIEIFQRFTQAVALAGRTDIPQNLRFTDLDLFGEYTARNGTNIDLNGLQGINQVTLPGTLMVNQDVEPWGTVFFRAREGNGSSLTWRVSGAQGVSAGSVPLSNAQ